jgi:alkaline phosphatase D
VSPTFPPPNHSVPDPAPFVDGVIAGDPLPDGSFIWTRVQPPVGGGPVGVLWTVSPDASFSSVAAGGVASATADGDHCVTVRVDGLEPDRWYWYRFEADGVASRIGRLRTAPAAGSSPDHLRFAFASCQQLNPSWFVAHKAAAAEPDLAFFMHLGDYVYVNDAGTLTLGNYRDVYHRWRKEPLLKDFHAKLPMVAMWDDGEMFNGHDQLPLDEPRLAAARRAWFENMPVVNPGADRAYRSLAWGDLLDLPVIDVREYRDPSLSTLDLTTPPGSDAYAPSRTTLGAEQYAWLVDQLTTSTAAWRMIGNGTPITPWRLVNLEFLRPFRPDMPPNAGLYVPSDGWDSYMVERRDLLKALADHGVSDNIFCTGQTHIYIASELRVDPDAGGPVVGYDFVSGSMTADPDPKKAYLKDLPPDIASGVLRLAEQWMVQQNPGMRYLNLEDQGYVVVDLTPEECVVEYRHVDTYDPDATPWTGAKFRVVKGSGAIEVLQAERQSGTPH